MTRTLVIFVKAPVAGRVKTRLAKDLGAGRAAAIYRRLTANTIAQAEIGNWRTILAVDPVGALRGYENLWPARIARIAQGRGDLGARMRRVLDKSPKGPVIIIGSDAPGLCARHIRAAFKALEGADAVFGPATDGGYWLIGFARRRGRAPAFDGVRWSSDNALKDTLASLPAGSRVTLLEALADIDDAADLATAGPAALMRSMARSGDGGTTFRDLA
ncbi:MAG: TIGR04282 family arsenosugar biosynthesis glycosyltransferase [Parvularculaceae bacterium]|nr:TIGR04282 family arsenosugar biosynthesis glycosyltransferase [Parvularculaceae bacterium]